jgi:hypothetical protein
MGNRFDDTEPEVTAEAEVAWDEVGYAEHDHYAGTTVLHDREGNVLGEIRAERTDDKDDDLGEALTLREKHGLVNEGSGVAELIGTFETPVVTERGERDEYGNLPQDPKTLTTSQAEQLAKPGITISKGGGGGGGGGKKSDRPIRQGRARPDDGAAGEGTTAGACRVSGITRGEWYWYHRRPGVAVEVLRNLVERILTNTADLEDLRRNPTAPSKHKRTLVIYGLTEHQHAVLSEFPGAARRALVKHARSLEPKRIDDLDGVHPAQAQSRSKNPQK